jgi:hypothetical protein
MESNNTQADPQTTDVRKLKREVIKLGDCGLMLFLLPFELVSCLLFLILLGSLVDGLHEGLWFIFIFWAIWHFVTQCAVTAIDPGGVSAGLESLSEGITDDEALKMLESLRAAPPEVEVVAEACNVTSTGSGKNRRTHTTVVHTARETLQYASWSDKTVCLTGLSKYRQLEFRVEPSLTCFDAATQTELDALVKRKVGECNSYSCHHVRSRTDIHVKAESYTFGATIAEASDGSTELADHNILATRSAGVKVSLFWSPSFYKACCWLCPGAGACYRILYFLTNRRYVLPVPKVVSIGTVAGFQEAKRDIASSASAQPSPSILGFTPDNVDRGNSTCSVESSIADTA